MSRWRVVVLVLAVVSGACSSTLDHDTSLDEGSSTESTLAPVANGKGSDVAVEEDGSGASIPRPPPGPAGGDEPVDDEGSGPATATSGRGRGVSATQIRIGISVADPGSYEETYAGLGAAGVSRPNEREAAEAVVDHINREGGIAGREVVPVFRQYSSNDNFSAAYEADCAAFTQDTEVFAAYSTHTSPGKDLLATCITQHDTAFILTAREVFDQEDFERWAHVYGPVYLRGDRWDMLVDELVALGYFDGEPTLGVIWQDTLATRRILEETIEPRLHTYGVEVAERAALAPYNSLGEMGANYGAMGNHVLRFRRSNVTHVLFIGTQAAGPLFFGAAAEGQGYRPRYGFNSTEAPQLTAANLPASQLVGAVGVGWWPFYDVEWAQDPGDHPAQARCLDLMHDAGVETPDRFAANQAANICDALLFLDVALERAPSLTLEGLRVAADELGGAFAAASTWNTGLGPGRWDGISTVRHLAFDEGCECFRYVSDPRPIG